MIAAVVLRLQENLRPATFLQRAQGVGKGKMQQLDNYYNFIGILDTSGEAYLPQNVMIDTKQGVAAVDITRKRAYKKKIGATFQLLLSTECSVSL